MLTGMSIGHHIPNNPAKTVGVTDHQREACRRVVAGWVAGNGYTADTAHQLMRMLGVLPHQDISSFAIDHVERVQWL